MSNSELGVFNVSTTIKQSLLGLLGQDCLLCGAHSASGLLCSGCAGELPRLSGPHLCPQCASPSPAGATCGRCLSHTPHYDRSIAAWRYAFPADRLLQTFKYGARLALAGFCTENIARAGGLHSDPFRPDALRIDLVLAMPLHPRRLAARGFNQALEIARPLSRMLALPVDAAALERTRDTAAHAGLRIAVVDDVMTSGAALNEVAKTLKRVGALHVENWVAARTPDHDR